MKRALWLWCAMAALSANTVQPLAEATSDSYRVPAHVFAGDPRGPYETGTFEELWINEALEDPSTADPHDKRKVMVQIWYPATDAPGAARARYVLHRELYPHDAQSRWLDDVAAVRATSMLRAPVARSGGRFPVLIYNPGSGYPPFSGTFQTEFLASHGYVVVGIGRGDISRIERFSDGARYAADVGTTFFQDMHAEVPFDVDRLHELAAKHAQTTLRTHVQDIRYVLDRLRALDENRDSRFHGRLDLQRVGSLGWSFGGALSLQASRDEPRIKAAVNLDGWLYTDVPETGTLRPVLQMHGVAPPMDRVPTPVEHEVELAAHALTWKLYARSRADWYDFVIQRAEHGNFSDLVLFEPADVRLIHPRLAHEIVNRVTLEFFDKYLRGVGPTPILSGELTYPDVKLVKSERVVQ